MDLDNLDDLVVWVRKQWELGYRLQGIKNLYKRLYDSDTIIHYPCRALLATPQPPIINGIVDKNWRTYPPIYYTIHSIEDLGRFKAAITVTETVMGINV